MIEDMLEEELESTLGAGRLERVGGARSGYRHGARECQLTTSLGKATIKLPRARPKGTHGTESEWHKPDYPGLCATQSNARAGSPRSWSFYPGVLLLGLPENSSQYHQRMARRTKRVIKRHTVRARTRGGSLDLLDRIPLREGDEVVVRISERRPQETSRRCGRLRELGEALSTLMRLSPTSTLIRLISTRPAPSA
jgi:hypothetical protein